MSLLDTRGCNNEGLNRIISSLIRERGSIGFDDFMRLALYDPEHGYYLTCDPVLDYQSSPNVHPVFGAMIARQVADFWRLLGRPARFEIFEAGAGNLSLASSVLFALQTQEPDLFDSLRYIVLEAALQEGAPLHLSEEAGNIVSKLAFATALPVGRTLEGCMISNELLDALPFRRVRKRDGTLYELNVALDADGFADIEVVASREVIDYFEPLGVEPGEDCEAEVNLEARDWMTRAASALKRGYLLTLDYGYPAHDLYAAQRKRGTLLTFYRHASGEDPYARIGRQDITASVDFTTIQMAGEAAGLQTYGLTTQTEMLTALGIGESLGRQPGSDKLEAHYALRRAVLELTEPSGLGRIRALIQGIRTPADAPLGLQLPVQNIASR